MGPAADNAFCSCKGTCSFCFTARVNTFFYKMGSTIATYPWTTIAVTWVCVAISTLGLLNVNYAAQGFLLSVREDSRLAKDTDWYLNTSGIIIRDEEILLQAPNVLDPTVLHQAAILTNEIMNLTVDSEDYTGIKWQDFCVKVHNIYPYTSVNVTTALKDMIHLPKNHPFEPVVDLDPEVFCNIFNSLNLVCYQQNLLALWRYDTATIKNLTLPEVIEKLNRTTIDPTTGHTIDVLRTLGGIERDGLGRIVSAKSMLMNFPVENTIQEIRSSNDKYKIIVNKDWVTMQAHAWETAFNKRVEQLRPSLERGTNTSIFCFSASSFGDNNQEISIEGLKIMLFGGILMFTFLLSVLSTFNWVEVRLFVGLAGLCSISMGLISGFGVGANFAKLTLSELTIPFITLGLGVDDIFVIMAGLKNIKAENKSATLPHILGLTLQTAGISITITTLTNVVVFLVGLAARSPYMIYYCVIAATCIFMTYCYVVTFFVAILAIDEQRIADRRNFLIPSIRHEIKLAKASDKDDGGVSWIATTLEWVYDRVLLTKVGRVVCILPSLFLVINCVPHMFDVQQSFDLRSFFVRNMSYYNFLTAKAELYPRLGHQAFIFLGSLNYSAELLKIEGLTKNLSMQTDITFHLNSWAVPFERFLLTYYDRDLGKQPLSQQEFKVFLNLFLHSTLGVEYRPFFTFESPITCGAPTSDIKMSIITFRYQALNESLKYGQAMDRMAELVDNANLTSGHSTVWCKIYYYWILNRTMLLEIIQNLSLGWIAVAFSAGILIVNVQMCGWIQLCVLLTMMNVVGFMHRMGLAFDQMTGLGLQMAVGLSVDYAVHLGHLFLKMQGTRQERVIKSIVDIAPPVFHGGLSTLLMFGALASLDAYAPQVFIKIFFLVVVFGLYHGLIFLPAILSLIGPKPYTEVQMGRANEHLSNVSQNKVT